MNHKVGRIVFALAVGLIVAFASYRWITNPEGRTERAIQVEVVETTRDQVQTILAGIAIEIVDPLLPNRKVGKVYVFREGDGWSVSGFYRRGEEDRWHAYLAALGPDLEITHLKIQDDAVDLKMKAAADKRLSITD